MEKKLLVNILITAYMASEIVKLVFFLVLTNYPIFLLNIRKYFFLCFFYCSLFYLLTILLFPFSLRDVVYFLLTIVVQLKSWFSLIELYLGRLVKNGIYLILLEKSFFLVNLFTRYWQHKWVRYNPVVWPTDQTALWLVKENRLFQRKLLFSFPRKSWLMTETDLGCQDDTRIS